MKLGITGASNFVNRMFEACGPFQWAREFLKNAQEASATRVEFGIEWEAVPKLGVYRRTIADDGDGMTREEIVRFFSQLGDGGKPIGGVHDNFGVGAKIASLPWNPTGVVVLSWKEGRGSMIWIRLDEDTGDYELFEFPTEEGLTVVVDPDEVDWMAANPQGVDWSKVRPDWIKDHGTMIVLLGSPGFPDTILGNPDAKESDLKGLSLYLNTRFWDLSDIQVDVVELSNAQKNLWPSSPSDSTSATRVQRRGAQGALYYLTKVKGDAAGRLCATDVMHVDEDRVPLEWYLWEGERPNIGPYAKKAGYIAVRYKGELFHLSSSKIHFRWFGIIETEVQQRTSLILEPPHYGEGVGKWGVHPDQSRNRLIFSGSGEKGIEVPLSDWGLEFAESMPEAILAAIMAARGEQTFELQDDEYRRRLQDKFGDRWRTKRLVATAGGKRAQEVSAIVEDEEEVSPDLDLDRLRSNLRRRLKQDKPLLLKKKSATEGGDGTGAEREAPVDVPRIRFAKKEVFQKDWHLASWVPNDRDGPTVLINIESGILQDVVEYHQEQYPEVYQEEVANIVRQVFGEVAVCKVAHSQKLVREVSEQVLNETYRSEEALTVALMGLLAEESLISQRLGKLGKKKG